MFDGRSSSVSWGVVYLHDYLLGGPSDVNCSTDVTGEVQAAVNAWIALQQQHQATPQLGEGCYCSAGTVVFGVQGSNQYIFGNVEADGPDLTSFHNRGGIKALEFYKLGNSDIVGFSVVGGDGASQQSWSNWCPRYANIWNAAGERWEALSSHTVLRWGELDLFALAGLWDQWKAPMEKSSRVV